MRLLRRADFNAGANINTFWRMPCRGALEAGSRKAMTWDNKHITWFGTPPFLSKPKETYSFLQSSALFIPVATATLDGGVGLLLPMQEKTYRRLLMLQNALTTMLSHHAGLNPKAFRCVWDARRPPLALSGDLVSDFPIVCLQNVALRPEKFAEPGEEHPGRRTPQQVPVPQHDGAQRAGQEDRDDSGHRKSKRQRPARWRSQAQPVLSLSRFWTTSWISTGSPLISEGHRTTSQRTVFTRQ